LRELRNWIVWRREKRANKSGVVRETKVPYDAISGKHAQSNNPSTWASFTVATEALKRGYDGLGFCLTSPLVAVDLDGCRPNGTDEAWAAEIIRELDCL
jgi:putative DNA primase/helicase